MIDKSALDAVKGIAGIYQIRNINSNKRYIGSAIVMEKRWGQHLREIRKGTHPNVKLQRAWNKHGAEAFEFSLIEAVEDKSMLLIREQFWIDFYTAHKVGYNISPSAGSLLGFEHSEVTKQRMSKAHLGKERTTEHRLSLSIANTGKKMSDESKMKMRLAKLGKKRKPHSAETKAKISVAMTGCTFTEEARAKMSLAKIGTKHSEETKQKMAASHKARFI